MNVEEQALYVRLCQAVEKAGLHLELHVVEKRLDRLSVRNPRTKATVASARVMRSLEHAAGEVLARLLVTEA